jgi:hypothetical protein
VYSKHQTNDNNTVEILLTNYEPRKSKIQNIF